MVPIPATCTSWMAGAFNSAVRMWVLAAGGGELSAKGVSVAVFNVSGVDVGALGTDPDTALFFVGLLTVQSGSVVVFSACALGGQAHCVGVILSQRGCLLVRGTVVESRFSSAWKAVPWVFVRGGSGTPTGGSVIGPYTTTTILYRSPSM